MSQVLYKCYIVWIFFIIVFLRRWWFTLCSHYLSFWQSFGCQYSETWLAGMIILEWGCHKTHSHKLAGLPHLFLCILILYMYCKDSTLTNVQLWPGGVCIHPLSANPDTYHHGIHGYERSSRTGLIYLSWISENVSVLLQPLHAWVRWCHMGCLA